MIATVKRMGRPKRPPTKQIRFREDLATMLDVICAADRKDTPDLTDELFRVLIQKRYNAALEKLNKLKKTKDSQ